MPDGDIVHEGLARKYQETFKQLCYGQFGGAKLAERVVPAFWKDIQNGGDKPIQLLRVVAEQCQQLLDSCVFGPIHQQEQIDWHKELVRIDELAQSIYTDRRFKTLAVEACKEMLQDLRNGGHPSNCHIGLLMKYMWNVYIAEFEARVPLSHFHDKYVNRELIGEKLEAMRPYVNEQLSQYAEQIYHHGTVHLVKPPRRRSRTKPNYNIDTDLSTVGA